MAPSGNIILSAKTVARSNLPSPSRVFEPDDAVRLRSTSCFLTCSFEPEESAT